MKCLILIILAATSPPLSAQVVELRGGSSTLFDASGGDATLHLRQTETEVGGGLLNGQPRYGFAERFTYRGWDVVAGDEYVTQAVGDTGVTLAVRGLTVERHDLTLFAGLTGQQLAAPFFRAAHANVGGAGVYYHRKLSSGWQATTLGLSRGTALGDLAYKRHDLLIGGGGGLFERKSLAQARASYRLNGRLAVSTNFLQTGAVRYGTVMGATSVGPLSVYASRLFNARGGATYGGSLRVWLLETGASYLAVPHNDSLNLSLGERISRRLRLTEYATRSQGRWSESLGGGFVANRWSVDVSQSTFFTPLSNVPLRQALLATLHVQLPWRSLGINIGSGVTPDGKIRYGIDGQTFVGESLDSGSGAGSGCCCCAGKFLIVGMVVDDRGEPVSGAAVRIGGQLTWTSTDGTFQVRVKHSRSTSLTVVPEEFTIPGMFKVVSAPPSAMPDTPVRIIVRRSS